MSFAHGGHGKSVTYISALERLADPSGAGDDPRLGMRGERELQVHALEEVAARIAAT